MNTRAANVWPAVLRAALHQARTTMIRKLTSAGGLSALVTSAIMLVILWFVRGVDFEDGLVNAGVFVLVGFLAFGVVAASVMGAAGELQAEREDGTLLRAKAVPHGMTGHLLAKLIVAPVDALLPILPVIIGASIIMPGIMPSSLWRWIAFAVVFLLAVMAMLPWGAVMGSVFRTMMGLGWAMMGMYALAAVSGLFYPITALPTVIQWLAQLTPLYWIGAAFRAVLLPADASVVEVGGDFHLPLTLAVLLAWTILGLVLAPIVLRRMARRQSGSTVAAARDRVLSKGY